MKKTLIVLVMVLLAAMLVVSCANEPKATYTIKFNAGSGTGSYQDQTVTEGAKATKPETNPKASNQYQTFKCWSIDGSEEYDFNEPVDCNIILTAVYRDLAVGDTGPAGGTIFYVNPSYNADSADNNWKYLEAGPTDLTANLDGEAVSNIVFGYYVTMDGTGYSAQIVTTENSESNGSGANAAIGKGKSNTTSLVQKTGGAWATNSSGSPSVTTNYAAKLCDDYSCGGYNDWFLPSLNELKELYSAYAAGNVGGTWHTRYSSSYTASDNEYYWTSSEYDANSAWTVCFGNGSIGELPRTYAYAYVRPVRAF